MARIFASPLQSSGRENDPRPHPNTLTAAHIRHELQREWGDNTGYDDDEEDEDDYEEEDTFDESTNPFVGCAFTTDRVDFGVPIGFYVHAVTEDGWVCSEGLRDNNDVGEHEECGEEGRPKKLLLLRLPSKVAAIGRQGMYVQHVDLMKRQDNGAVEPCNRRSYMYGFMNRFSTVDLHGRISL